MNNNSPSRTRRLLSTTEELKHQKDMDGLISMIRKRCRRRVEKMPLPRLKIILKRRLRKKHQQ